MRPLTAETIEMARQGLLASDWCGFSKRDTVNQLCDLALKGLTAPSLKDAPLAELEQANALPDKESECQCVGCSAVRLALARLLRHTDVHSAGETEYERDVIAAREALSGAPSAGVSITPHDNSRDVIEQCARLVEAYGQEADRTAKEYACEMADELAARLRALKSTHSASESISAAPSAQYDPMASFDKCDGGLPCMQTTTGCAKGQCSRRRPHAYLQFEGQTDKPCLICQKPAAEHPQTFMIALDPSLHSPDRNARDA